MDVCTFSKIIATVQSHAEYLAAVPWNAFYFLVQAYFQDGDMTLSLHFLAVFISK